MASQLGTVLEIAGIGTTLLFLALVGLVGLMYLLTTPWAFLQGSQPVPEAPPTDEAADDREQEEQAERDRQIRAVALAVAVACAEAERPATLVTDAAAGWRGLHRSRRLSQQTARARVRT